MHADVQSAKHPAWPCHQSAGFVVLKGCPPLQVKICTAQFPWCNTGRGCEEVFSLWKDHSLSPERIEEGGTAPTLGCWRHMLHIWKGLKDVTIHTQNLGIAPAVSSWWSMHMAEKLTVTDSKLKVSCNVYVLLQKPTHLFQILFNFSVFTTARRCSIYKGSDSMSLIQDLEQLVGYFSEEIAGGGSWSLSLYFHSLPHPIYHKKNMWAVER